MLCFGLGCDVCCVLLAVFRRTGSIRDRSARYSPILDIEVLFPRLRMLAWRCTYNCTRSFCISGICGYFFPVRPAFPAFTKRCVNCHLDPFYFWKPMLCSVFTGRPQYYGTANRSLHFVTPTWIGSGREEKRRPFRDDFHPDWQSLPLRML